MSFLFILGHQAVRGFARPIITDRILQFTHDDKRATVLSLNSMGSRLFFALTGPLVGWVSETESTPTTLYAQAAALVVILLGLGWAYLRIPSKYFSPKQAPATPSR